MSDKAYPHHGKKCSRCGKYKDLTDFYKRTKALDGLYHWCKSCACTNAKKYNKRLGERVCVTIPSEKKCRKCLKVKPAEQFSLDKTDLSGLQRVCRTCNSLYSSTRHATLRASGDLMWVARRLCHSTREGAKIRGFRHELTPEEIYGLIVISKCFCALCGKKCDTRGKDADSKDRPSIDQIIPGGGYIRSNVKLLCKHCNSRKGALSLRETETILSWQLVASRALDEEGF